MSDYRDIISGAIDKVVDKVKDYTDGKSAREIYEEGMDRVSSYGKAAMIKLDITGAREQLRDAYTEVGRQFYGENRDSVPEQYAEIFERINALRDEIIAKQEKVDQLLSRDEETPESELDVEFGEIVDQFEDK